jgi:Recombinase
MSRRRLRRRSAKAQRPPVADRAAAVSAKAVREATRVERLAYTRTQAAAALGVSRSTFDRRVLPLLETIEMPWGTQLIPVDELERLLAAHRSEARRRVTPRTRPGRRAAVAPNVAGRIRAEHAAGKSLGEIARELTADKVPTAHGARQWWPSTVRAVLLRAAGSKSAQVGN